MTTNFTALNSTSVLSHSAVGQKLARVWLVALRFTSPTSYWEALAPVCRVIEVVGRIQFLEVVRLHAGCQLGDILSS